MRFEIRLKWKTELSIQNMKVVHDVVLTSKGKIQFSPLNDACGEIIY